MDNEGEKGKNKIMKNEKGRRKRRKKKKIMEENKRGRS